MEVVIIVTSIRNWMQTHGIGKGILLSSLIFIFLMGYLMFGTYFAAVFTQYTINEEPITISVGDSATITTVGGILDQAGIMDQERFIFYNRIYTSYDVYLKKVFEGSYTIPPKTHIKDLIKILKL